MIEGEVAKAEARGREMSGMLMHDVNISRINKKFKKRKRKTKMPHKLASRQSDRYISTRKGLFPDNSSLYKTDQKTKTETKTKAKQKNLKMTGLFIEMHNSIILWLLN